MASYHPYAVLSAFDVQIHCQRLLFPTRRDSSVNVTKELRNLKINGRILAFLTAELGQRRRQSGLRRSM